jgi:hypothetical protein
VTPLSIDPHGHARTPFDRTGGVDEMTVRGNRVRGHPGVRAHEDTIRHGKRLARHLQSIGVERDGQEFPFASVDEMPRRRVAGARPALDENGFGRLERQTQLRIVIE